MKGFVLVLALQVIIIISGKFGFAFKLYLCGKFYVKWAIYPEREVGLQEVLRSPTRLKLFIN